MRRKMKRIMVDELAIPIVLMVILALLWIK